VIEPATFVSGPAPDGLELWELPDPPSSKRYDRVEVTVLLERLSLADLDFELISDVVANVDRYLEAAENLVASRVREEPEFFGLTAAPDEVRLGLPEVTFSDSGWLIHFTEAPFPIADPYGLFVEFTDRTPTLVSGTDDAEEV
jgi:hypothetical protein